MINRASSKNIWVTAEGSIGGDGSKDTPFSSIQAAVEAAKPGETVVLQAGTYKESLSLNEMSGEENAPITITGESEGAVTLLAEWYFYSVSDFIISDLTFKDVKNSAISIVGDSKRNIFKKIKFEDCGTIANCSFFTGGSGGEGNVIEACRFENSTESRDHIGVMFSQSKDEEDNSIAISRNMVLRYCSFSQMGTAILAGSGDDIAEYGYISIEDSLIENSYEGIRIKSNGTTVKGMIFHNVTTAILHVEGVDADINDNRFEKCAHAVLCSFGDITIHENCFIDSAFKVDVELCGLPVIVHNNSFVFSSPQTFLDSSGEGECYAVFSDNIFYNAECTPFTGVHFHGNLSNIDGAFVEVGTISFVDTVNGDYRAELAIGCNSGAVKRTAIEVPQTLDLSDLAKEHGFSTEDLSGSIEKREVFLKSLFPDLGEEEDEVDEGPEFEEMEDYFDTSDE